FPFGSAGVEAFRALARSHCLQQLAVKRITFAVTHEEAAPVAFAVRMEPGPRRGKSAPAALALLERPGRGERREEDGESVRIERQLGGQFAGGQSGIGNGTEQAELVGYGACGQAKLRFPHVPDHAVVGGWRQVAHAVPLPNGTALITAARGLGSPL